MGGLHLVFFLFNVFYRVYHTSVVYCFLLLNSVMFCNMMHFATGLPADKFLGFHNYEIKRLRKNLPKSLK